METTLMQLDKRPKEHYQELAQQYSLWMTKNYFNKHQARFERISILTQESCRLKLDLEEKRSFQDQYLLSRKIKETEKLLNKEIRFYKMYLKKRSNSELTTMVIESLI